jgi:arylsulfatase A-like enzyme
MRTVSALVALLALLGETGCSRRPTDPEDVRVDDLSVVLVVLDAAGARHFGAYGSARPTSPHFDELARDGGTLFTRAYAQSAWTLPSTASILTGRYPARRKQTRTRVGGQTLATALRDAGFATAAFSENPYVTMTYGFDRGFDSFHAFFPKALLDEDPRFYRTESARPTTEAIAWLDANASRRAFLYLHLLTPHSPYQPPPPFRDRFADQYNGAIEGVTDTLLRINEGTLTVTPRDIEHLRRRYEENLAYADHQLGRVLDSLRRDDRLDRTIVIVTADHGEAFREHGVMLHTTTLFEEMIHVPLLVRLPPRFGRQPPRWTGVVELRDLFPTLCHALHLSCGVGTARSLLRDFRARTPPAGRARAWTSDSGSFALGAIVTDRRKLVLEMKARRAALYDLQTDPSEHRDLSQTDPARVRRLVRRLRAPRGPVVSGTITDTVSGETADHLRALGYAH